MSIAGVSVRRVVDFERRSITNRFELPPCCRLMMTRWPSGREPRRERHAGEIADDLALAGLDIEQIDPGVALAELHIGDFLGRGREPRRQHEVGAARKIAHIGAVLVHQRQPLDAPLLRPALVDEHHAAVEVALLSGQPLVDLVGNDVRDAPPVFRRGKIVLAGECWPVSTSQRRNSAFSRPSP